MYKVVIEVHYNNNNNKKLKQSKFLSRGKLKYIHLMVYSSVKMNNLELHVLACVNFMT